MAITSDILAAWRGPRRMIRRKLDQAPREEQALAILMLACFLLFVASWPGLAREAQLRLQEAAQTGLPLDQVPSLQALMGGRLMAVIFILPLLLYALAGLSHLVARAVGGKGTGLAARLALFWAMLAIAPAMLFQGLVAGLIGPGTQLLVLGIGVGVAFLWLWLSMLIEAER
jgi:hypothetical protein